MPFLSAFPGAHHQGVRQGVLHADADTHVDFPENPGRNQFDCHAEEEEKDYDTGCHPDISFAGTGYDVNNPFGKPDIEQ